MTLQAMLLTGKGFDADALFRKLNWRLLPLFWLMVVLNYIDRTNLAFAALQLNDDLGFTPQVYGLGSGLFFATYATLQIPSNLLLRRIGGPSWLSAIIAAWGTVAVSFSLMRTKEQFFVLRTLLGVAEAGAFPGMWFMLNRFYPSDRITLAFAIVESGITLSHTIAGPLAAALLTMDGLGGMRGWQWLFLLEGLPSLVLAVAIWSLLPAGPETMSWLNQAEREYLRSKLPAHTRSASFKACDDDNEVTIPLLEVTPGVEPAVSMSSAVKNSGESVRHFLGSSPSTPALHAGATGGAGSGQCRAAGDLGWIGRLTWLPPDVRQALHASVTNKYVWYLGAVKITRDIAGFGIIFYAPMVVQALVSGKGLDVSALHSGSGHKKLLTANTMRAPDPAASVAGVRQLLSWASRHLLGGSEPAAPPTGIKAALLTSVPFGMAAMATLFVAHRSQESGERVLHIAIPALACGLVFALFPAVTSVSMLAGFACLCCGVVGVNCIAAPSLALLSEAAAGPGLVVALPMYNSIGNMGGFIGPYIIGILLAQTHSFALPCVMMGTCLACSGILVALLPYLLGLPQGSSSKHRR